MVTSYGNISSLISRSAFIALSVILASPFSFVLAPVHADDLSATSTTTTTSKLPDELKGKTVRSIRVVLDEIFDGADLDWIYQEANRLKVSTREEVIRRELLFKEGDSIDRFILQESERVLRDLGYLRRIRIESIVSGDMVDLVVHAQDTWTLIPQFSYSSGSGKNSKSAGLSESNILGYGKRFEALYQEDEGRNIVEAVWDDPRVWGSDTSILAAIFSRSDGEHDILSVGRPFRSVLDRSAWSINTDVNDTVGRLFKNGDVRYIFRQNNVSVSSRYTVTLGNPEISAQRLSFGYDFEEDSFKQATLVDYGHLNLEPTEVSNDLSELPNHRRFSGPAFAFQRIKPDFVSMNYIDRFDRVEDYNLGGEYSFNFTLSPTFLGSMENAVLASANRAAGKRFSDSAFFRGEAGISTRYEEGGFANTLGRVELKYYNVLGELYLGDRFLGRHTLASSFFVDYGQKLDGDREFLIGGDNALRGYKARTFVGDKRLALNIEDRVHFIDDVFKVFSVGAAVFAEAGGTTDSGIGNIFAQNLYTDVGVGLRIAFPRSTGGKILRVDFAVPLRDGPDGSGQFQLRVIFGGGQLFSSRLRSELLGTEKANVAIGLDR